MKMMLALILASHSLVNKHNAILLGSKCKIVVLKVTSMIDYKKYLYQNVKQGYIALNMNFSVFGVGARVLKSIKPYLYFKI